MAAGVAPRGTPDRSTRIAALKRRRRREAMEIVRCHAVLSAAANFVPIPVLDGVVVAGVQMQMMRELSRYYRRPFDSSSARALFASVGVGALHFGVGRTALAQQLGTAVAAVPVIGGVLRWGTWPGVLGTYTYLLGQSCVEHFEEDKDLGEFSKSILARMPLNPLVGVT